MCSQTLIIFSLKLLFARVNNLCCFSRVSQVSNPMAFGKTKRSATADLSPAVGLQSRHGWRAERRHKNLAQTLYPFMDYENMHFLQKQHAGFTHVTAGCVHSGQTHQRRRVNHHHVWLALCRSERKAFVCSPLLEGHLPLTTEDFWQIKTPRTWLK